MDTGLIDIMKKLGFSEYESKVYAALVSVGGGTASEVAKISQVPTNRVYQILSDLGEKGIVRIQSSITTTNYYYPEEPSIVMDRIEASYREAIKEARNTLEALYERAKRSSLPDIWTLRGDNAVYEKIAGVIKSAREYVYLIVDTLFDFKEHDLIPLIKSASRIGIKVKIITAASGIDDEGEQAVLEELQEIAELQVMETLESLLVTNDRNHILIGGFGVIGGHERGFIALWSQTDGLASIARLMFENVWEALSTGTPIKRNIDKRTITRREDPNELRERKKQEIKERLSDKPDLDEEDIEKERVRQLKQDNIKPRPTYGELPKKE